MSEESAVMEPRQDDTTVQHVHQFEKSDLSQFEADDTAAGRAICKMLSLFFFYTVIVMGLSTLVTYYWVTK